MLNPETVIGDRYIVKRKLAEGGMAEIYLCTAMGPEGFEKEVVIKRIRSFWGGDDMFVQMFIAEARLASRLNHTNIVQIFHFDKHEDTYYLAMEFVNGPSLRDFLRKSKEKNQPLPILLASDIVANIARGLHYAHNLNIVHRDVSPHNILLSFDGNVKLADFGIAKTNTQHTSPGVLKGKFAYMAPEQARGEPVDARTDVFALGIVLWESLTRSRLFEYDNYVNALQALQENLIVQPSRFNPEVPEELDRIVLRALNRNPAARYQTAQEFERALLNFILHHARCADDTNLSHFLRTVYEDASVSPPPEKKEGLTRTYTPPSSPSQKSSPIFMRSPESAYVRLPESAYVRSPESAYVRSPESAKQPGTFAQPKSKTPLPVPVELNPLAITQEFAGMPDQAASTQHYTSLAHLSRHPVAIAFAIVLAIVLSAGIGAYGTLRLQGANGNPGKAAPVVSPELLSKDFASPKPEQTHLPHMPPEDTGTEKQTPGQNVSIATLSLDLPLELLENVVPPSPVGAPEPPQTAAAQLPPAPTARLTIEARPWARVSINNAGPTEVVGRRVFRLQPGTHRVRFVHPSKEEVKTIHIRQATDNQSLFFNASSP